MGAKNIVRVSNEMVRCVQRLTLNEKRLLMLIIAKAENVDSDVETSVSDYCDTYSTDRNNTYRAMKNAQERLWNAEFIIDSKRRRWLITTDYIENAGSITSRIHPDLKEHVSELKQCYTQYFLKRAGNFRSIYSWRLFELLMQFRKTGVLSISVDEFKEVLEIPEAYNVDFSAIRHKVINKAIKEIKAGGLPVKLTTHKRGRTITRLEFTFPTEQQADWITKQSEQPQQTKQVTRVTKKYIEKHARPGESYEDARQRLERELKKSAQEVSQQQKTA